MTENANKPSIRFKGFTDAWEQRKLADVAKINMGQSPDGVNYTTNPNDAILVQGNADLADGWVSPRVYTKQITKKAHVGDLIFSVRAPVGEVGKTQYNVVIGRGVAAISGNEFIFQSLKRMNIFGYWTKLSAGSTFESINSDTLKAAEFAIPKEDEQIKIGEILLKIDNLITLHQRKYDKLVNVKKSLLEKMFPSGDERVPKIRFKGFTDSWEQRKVKNIAETTYGGGTPSTANNALWEGAIPWIQSSDLTEHDVLNVSVKKHISDKAIKQTATKLVPQDSIAIITRVGVGKVAYMPFSYTTSQDFVSLSKLKVNALFAVYSLYLRLQKDMSIVQGTSIKGITKEELLDKSIGVPNMESEQTQIGVIFKQLDNLITLHQRKLEKLKNIKKSLLEKMFV